MFSLALATAVFLTAAQAADSSQEITITGTRVKTNPYDFATRGPVQQVTVTARVPVELDTLTLNSGVAILKDDVREAARRACTSADPRASAAADVTMDCIHRAVNDAQPQINALIARAHEDEAQG